MKYSVAPQTVLEQGGGDRWVGTVTHRSGTGKRKGGEKEGRYITGRKFHDDLLLGQGRWFIVRLDPRTGV